MRRSSSIWSWSAWAIRRRRPRRSSTSCAASWPRMPARAETMSFRTTSMRFGIAAKLYCVAALSCAAVAVLAWSPFHFSRITELAARHLYENDFADVLKSARLEVLLERHRRLVESAPSEFDQARLRENRRKLDQAAR